MHVYTVLKITQDFKKKSKKLDMVHELKMI